MVLKDKARSLFTAERGIPLSCFKESYCFLYTYLSTQDKAVGKQHTKTIQVYPSSNRPQMRHFVWQSHNKKKHISAFNHLQLLQTSLQLMQGMTVKLHKRTIQNRSKTKSPTSSPPHPTSSAPPFTPISPSGLTCRIHCLVDIFVRWVAQNAFEERHVSEQ